MLHDISGPSDAYFVRSRLLPHAGPLFFRCEGDRSLQFPASSSRSSGKTRLTVIRFGPICAERVEWHFSQREPRLKDSESGTPTIKRWVRNGKVRTTRTEGGHHRVADSEIERLLARQQAPPRRRVTAPVDAESLGGLSARNRLWGFIDEVRVDGLLAQVRLRVGNQVLTAVITADAVRALKLRRGEDAIAIVKSTEVMIARPFKGPK